jgi:hypothetical protein
MGSQSAKRHSIWAAATVLSMLTQLSDAAKMIDDGFYDPRPCYVSGANYRTNTAGLLLGQ